VHTGAHHVGVAGLHHSLRQRRSLETNKHKTSGICGATKKICVPCRWRRTRRRSGRTGGRPALCAQGTCPGSCCPTPPAPVVDYPTIMIVLLPPARRSIGIPTTATICGGSAYVGL
jgi:hypothetical protein